MKTIKLKIEKSDLENPAVVSAVNALFLAIGGHHSKEELKQDLSKAVEVLKSEPEKPAKTKKVKEVPQVDTEKEKAKEALAELKEEEASEVDLVEAREEENSPVKEEPKTSKIDIAAVRKLLGEKTSNELLGAATADANRVKIRAKLKELGGATSITTLSPEYYGDAYKFMSSL